MKRYSKSIVGIYSNGYIKGQLRLSAKLNEFQRREYLSAMGIDVFYSENSVPAKKKDRGLVLSQISNSSDKSFSTQFSRDSQKPLRAIQENLNQEKNKDDRTGTYRAEPNKSSDVEDSHSSFGFSLNYYFLNEKLAVLEEIPLSRSQFTRNDYLNLLHKILVALGACGENQSFDAERISWPVAEGFSMPTDQHSAARLMVSGFIRRKSQEAKFANLLVFANTISDFFVRQKKAGSMKDYFDETQGFHLTISQSLDAMLTHSDLKRDVWQQLQPLRKRITLE